MRFVVHKEGDTARFHTHKDEKSRVRVDSIRIRADDYDVGASLYYVSISGITQFLAEVVAGAWSGKWWRQFGGVGGGQTLPLVKEMTVFPQWFIDGDVIHLPTASRDLPQGRIWGTS